MERPMAAISFVPQSGAAFPVQDTLETPCALISCSRQLIVLNRACYPLLMYIVPIDRHILTRSGEESGAF